MKKKSKDKKRFEVRGSVSNLNLTRAGSAIVLEVRSRSGKLGEIQIGQGSLFWWGANRRIRKRIGWGKFAEMMNQLAYGE